jgi:hypothetical protein
MDDIFKSPTRLLSQHKPQTPWELPLLSFERRDSLPTGTQASSSGANTQAVESRIASTGSASVAAKTEIEKVAAKTATSAQRDEQAEHDLLVEAGLVSPDSVGSEPSNILDDLDKVRMPDTDGNNDSLSKVRHSLHRKLQSTHGPNHHRSKKGKDSSSSAALTEDNGSLAESEGLPRSKGSFTVHGKKASVITFGSEWQTMSPEERLKMRKQAQMEDSRLSVPVIDDDGASTDGGYAGRRPVSSRSVSTTTTKSLGQMPSSADLQPPESVRSGVSGHGIESDYLRVDIPTDERPGSRNGA